MTKGTLLLKEAVDLLREVVKSSHTPYPIDANVIQVVPVWNTLLNAVVEEGRELYFTVIYDEAIARAEAKASSTTYIVTKVKGRFKEISNLANITLATYKYVIENVEYIPVSSDIAVEPALKPQEIELHTWFALYEFLAKLIVNDVTWEIL